MIKAYFLMLMPKEEELRREGVFEAKLAAQIGHGTDLIHAHGLNTPDYCRWLCNTDSDRRKIVLRLKSHEEMYALKRILEQAGIGHESILDSGYSGYNTPTVTGLVIFPVEAEKLPKRIKRLRAWKDR